MKKLFLIVVIFFISFTSYACTNFSGDYKWGDDWTLRMTQNACESITIIDAINDNDEDPRIDLKFNGEYMYIGSEGNSKVYTNNALVDDKWIMINKTEQLKPNGDVVINIVSAERFLNADGDIEEIAKHQGGSETKYVFKKIK